MSLSLKDRKLLDEFFLRCLIFGAAGAGKTSLFGTFPKPMLVFDFDHKLKPLYGLDIDVESFDLDDKKDCGKEFDRFFTIFKREKNNPKWKTIVFDSLTSFDTLLLYALQGKAGKIELDTSLDIYKSQSSWFNFFFLELNAQKLQKNVVVTAHEHYIVEDESKIHRITPLITGSKIIGKLPAFFEEVYYCRCVQEGAKTKYLMHYRPHGRAIANSLVLKGGEGFIENPSYDKIVALAKSGEQKVIPPPPSVGK